MNTAITQHYPASKLPDELRQGIDPDRRVTVTVSVEDETRRRPPTKEHLKELLKTVRENPIDTSTEEAVARIRALRDEWDD